MSVLIVIPCLNEAALIGQLLDQLLSKTTVNLIAVTDGGSKDGTLDVVAQHISKTDRVYLVDNPAKIQSAGVNKAVKLHGGTCDWLLRIDAHCLYPDNYVETLLQSAQENNADCVVVPMLTIGKHGFQKAVATAQNSVLGTGGSAHRQGGKGQFVDHGHHALMRLDLFQKAGGYCEAMPCNEDAELDFRLSQLGAKIWLEPQAEIQYFPRGTVSGLWRQYFKYGVGRACNLRRHKMRPHLRQVLPLVVTLAALILPLVTLHPIFAVPFLAWLSLCLCFGLLVGGRNGGGWNLLSGLAAATMHLSWGLGFLFDFVRRPKGVKARYGLLGTSRE